MRVAALDEIARALPLLREQVQRSRAMASGAVARARLAAEKAAVRRRLLESRVHQGGEATTLNSQIWNAAAAELESMARERDRALGVLAHELRQPLAAALAAERLLSVSPDSRAADRAHVVLERQLHHLSELVDGLLDYSRLSLGATALALVPVQIAEVVDAAVETMQPALQQQQQTLTVTGLELARSSAAEVLGDEGRLRQALLNLLQNASRYTPPQGSVEIAVAVEPSVIEVTVRDTGQGIPPDRLEQIFEPFVRLAKAGPGLGIGLALVRRVAELHGGRVTAESGGTGLGSSFSLVLPRRELRRPAAPADASSS